MLRDTSAAFQHLNVATDSPTNSSAIATRQATEVACEATFDDQLPTVLLVDDDPDSLILLEIILNEFSCRVVSRESGQSALAYAKQQPPALILLDIWLSDMNGLEVAKALQQEHGEKSIPLVAVTALASEDDRQTILQAGFTHYISKPYSLEAIETLLNQYLQWREEAVAEVVINA